MRLREKLKKHLGLRGNLPALAMSEAVSSTGWNMINVVWQPFVLSLGATMPILGSLTGLQTALGSGLQLVTGRISDCVGRKRLLALSYILAITGIFLSIWARSWLFLVPSIVVFSISGSLWEPAFSSTVAESVEKGERGTAFSLISLAWFLPGFFAPALGGLIAERYGIRPVLGVLLVTELSAFVLIMAYLKETLERSALDLRGIFSSLREVLAPRFGLSRFYAVVIIDRFAWAIMEGIFLGMLLKTFNFTLIQLGVLMNVVSISAASSQMFVGKLVDRYGRRPVLIASGCIWSCALGGYLISGSFPSFMLCQALLGLAVSTWDPAVNSYLSNAVPDEERSRFFGDLNGLKGLASFPAPILGAFLYEAHGFRAPILASFLLSLVVITLSILVKER